MQHILISGAGGYIGTRMVETFLSKGYRIRAVDRFFFGATLDLYKNHPLLEIIRADTRSLSTDYFDHIDLVIDLSGISNDPAADLIPKLSFAINKDAPLDMAYKARDRGVRGFIFSSSCSVYGDGNGNKLDENSPLKPVSTYARTKVEAEKLLLDLNTDIFHTTILRNATVYGLSPQRMRFDLIINIMTLNAWKNNKIYVMGGGDQWRPLIHIDDLIHFYHLVAMATRDKVKGQIFNVGFDDQNFQVLEIAYKFKSFFDRLEIEIIPDDPDLRDYRVSFSKIHHAFGYLPTKNIADGIAEIKTALQNGIVKETITSRTVQYYKYLLEADKLITSLKLNGHLLE